jgi:hypothetical protein
VLLPPVGDSDLANDLNNLHWYLVFAAFWCLLWRPRTFGARVAGSVVVFFAVASDGSALLLLPLVLGRYIALRGADAGAGAKSLRSGRRRLLRPAAELGPVVAFAAGAVLQVLLRGGPGSTVDFTATIAGLARTFAVRILLGGIAGPPLTARAWQAGGWWLVSLSALVVLVVLISGALPAETRPLVLLMLVCSLVWFVAPDVVRGNDPIWSVGRSLDSGKRYAAVPTWFLAAIVAVSLDNALTRLRGARSWRRLVPAGAVPALACLGILAGLVTSYSAHNLRQYGPVWTAQVSEAAQDCRSDHTALVTVPIAPEISARPWVTRIPCSDGRLR